MTVLLKSVDVRKSMSKYCLKSDKYIFKNTVKKLKTRGEMISIS